MRETEQIWAFSIPRVKLNRDLSWLSALRRKKAEVTSASGELSGDVSPAPDSALSTLRPWGQITQHLWAQVFIRRRR